MNLRNTSIVRRKRTFLFFLNIIDYLFYFILASSTNLINNDVIKPIASNILSTGIPQTTSISGSNINSPQPTISSFCFYLNFFSKTVLCLDETPSVIPITTIESSSDTDTPSPIVKTETVKRRIAAPSDVESSNEKKNLSDNNNNNLSLAKSTTRSIITDSSKTNQEEITTTQSRLVVNRNVVISESMNVPNRTIVQTIPSSNRVVVSSNSIISPSKGKTKDVDLVEQENKIKKFKQDSQSSK